MEFLHLPISVALSIERTLLGIYTPHQFALAGVSYYSVKHHEEITPFVASPSTPAGRVPAFVSGVSGQHAPTMVIQLCEEELSQPDSILASLELIFVHFERKENRNEFNPRS